MQGQISLDLNVGDSKSNDLFKQPLAAKMRPRTLDEIIGQESILGKDKPLRKSIENNSLSSIILWGPPGCGKTTVAEVIANITNANFSRVSAVSSGVAELRSIVNEAKRLLESQSKRTILFIDEIHRFNKSQQDAILPFVEDGTIILIGATTENPSFEINNALLSRSRLFVLSPLSKDDILNILKTSLNDEIRGFGKLNISISDDILERIAVFSNGDARTSLNILELAVNSENTTEGQSIVINKDVIEDIIQNKSFLYDKNGDQHYDIISALHKSLRGSDPDASLYWLARMLEGGEDPLYIIRRLIRFASEDVGMADPQALPICIAAQQAVHFLGLPESNLPLAQAVVYLAAAPKSNSLYEAYNKVQEEVRNTSTEPVPLHLRNAPTRMMKDLNYGKDYKYPHDFYKEIDIQKSNRPPIEALQDYLPENLKGKEYYSPTNQGNEADIKEWLNKRRSVKKDV